MNLYTCDQLFNDIKQFENLEWRANSKLKNARFLKLYSDIFAKPLSDNNTVNDFQKRLSEFLYTKNVMLPACYEFPNNDYRFWVYKMNCNKSGKLFMNEPMALMLSTNTEKDVLSLVKVTTGAFGTLSKVCIVDTFSEEISCFEKAVS